MQRRLLLGVFFGVLAFMAYVASEPRLRGTAVQGGTLRIARKGGWGGLAWRTMRRKGEGMGMRGLGRVVSRCVAQDSESKLEISKETRLKLMTLGFVDEEANLAAIAKAKGDIPLAIKILNSDAADEWNGERRDIDVLMEKGG